MAAALMGDVYGIAHNTTTSADNAVQMQMKRILGFPKDTGHAWRAGDQLYYDATAVKATRTPGPYILGKAVAAATAGATTGDLLIDARVGSLLGAQLVASAAVTNTITETAFDKTVVIPAAYLADGAVLRIRAQAIATATNSTDTLALRLRIAGTSVVLTTALDVANNDIGVIDALVTIRTDGAGGTMVASGSWNTGVPGTATARAFALASTAIDTTAAITVDVTATWSVANAGNSCRLDQLVVERVG
jgi:predicted RecA/RadA family phage recombinase